MAGPATAAPGIAVPGAAVPGTTVPAVSVPTHAKPRQPSEGAGGKGAAGEAERRPASGARLVALGILSSKIFGLVREIALARFLGVSAFNDVLRSAMRAPNVLQNLLGEQTLSAVFIPIYSRMLEEGREEDAGRFAGAILGLMVVTVFALVLLGIVFAPQIVAVLSAGYLRDAELVAEGVRSVDRYALLVQAVRYIFPMSGVMVLAAWAMGVLNSHRRFFLPYMAPAFWNMTILAFLFGSAWKSGFWWNPSAASDSVVTSWLFAICLGALVGGLLQFLVQVPQVLRYTRGLRLRVSTRVAGVREALSAFLPAVAGRGVVQLSLYLDNFLATFLAPGAPSAIQFAGVLINLPLGAFGMSVAAAELPELSRADLGSSPAGPPSHARGPSGKVPGTRTAGGKVPGTGTEGSPTDSGAPGSDEAGSDETGSNKTGARTHADHAAADLDAQIRAARHAMAERVDRALRQSAFLICPSVAGYLLFGTLVVAMLYRWGEFDLVSQWLVWAVLGCYAIGLLASAMSRLLQNTFFALRDTRTPAKVAGVRLLASATLGAGLMVWLDRYAVGQAIGVSHGEELYFGACGLAVGSSVGAWGELGLLLFFLRRRLPELVLPLAPIFRRLGLAFVLAGPALVLWWFLRHTHFRVQGLLVLSTYAATYLGWAAWHGFPELEAWVGRLRRRRR